MHKIVVGLGAALLTVGAITITLFLLGTPFNVDPFSYFHLNNVILAENAIIATFTLVTGYILVFWGSKKHQKKYKMTTTKTFTKISPHNRQAHH
jgi:hypothetical protein